MSQQINLFNPIFLKKKKYFSALTMAQGLGLILLGSIAVVMFAHVQLDTLKSETVSTAHQLKQTKAQLAKVAAEYPPRQKSKELDQEIAQVEAEIKQQKQALDIVLQGGVGNANGYSEYLRAFSRQIVGGLWLTGFRISGIDNQIELQGRALQPQLVPGYINRLKHEAVMQGKAFETLTMEVPEVDVKNDVGGSGKQRALASYIEFTLRSADEGTSTLKGIASAGAEAAKLVEMRAK